MPKLSDQLSTTRSRAVRLDSFGGPEVLNIIEVPAPEPGPGQVRVRVTAAPGALEKLARLVATGRLRVPIAATFRVGQIRTAVELQAGRHVKGKVVIDL